MDRVRFSESLPSESTFREYDRPAAELAVHFYRHVLEGEPTGEALRLARNEIRVPYRNDILWAAYVLYGDPTYRLIEA